MKSGKAWCLALGCFVGASLGPAANAQRQDQDQPNEAGYVVAQQSLEQSGSASDPGPGEQNPKGSAPRQQAGQPGQNKLNSQQPNENQQAYWRYSKDLQGQRGWWQYPNWPNKDQA